MGQRFRAPNFENTSFATWPIFSHLPIHVVFSFPAPFVRLDSSLFTVRAPASGEKRPQEQQSTCPTAKPFRQCNQQVIGIGWSIYVSFWGRSGRSPYVSYMPISLASPSSMVRQTRVFHTWVQFSEHKLLIIKSRCHALYKITWIFHATWPTHSWLS